MRSYRLVKQPEDPEIMAGSTLKVDYLPRYLNIVLTVEVNGAEPLQVLVKNGSLLDCKLLNGKGISFHQQPDGFVALEGTSNPRSPMSPFTEQSLNIKKEAGEDTLAMPSDLDTHNDSFPMLDLLELNAVAGTDGFGIPNELTLEGDTLESSLQEQMEIAHVVPVPVNCRVSEEKVATPTKESTNSPMSTNDKTHTIKREKDSDFEVSTVQTRSKVRTTSNSKHSAKASVKRTKRLQAGISTQKKKQKYTDKAELAEFIESTEDGETLRCKICGIESAASSVCLLHRHVRGVHLNAASRDEDYEWREAKGVISNSTTPRCFVCETDYPDYDSLTTHLSVHLVQRYYTEAEMLRLLCLTHARKARDMPGFQCIKCDFSEKDLVLLKSHILKDHLKILTTQERRELVETIYQDLISKSGDGKWMCNLCSYSHSNRPALKGHVHKRHIQKLGKDVDPEVEETVATSKTDPTNIAVGGATVTKASMMHCQKLLENFHKDRLRDHVPIICDLCGYAASFKHRLETHKAIQHGITDQTHPCPKCPKIASTLKQLKVHLKNVHSPDMMTCPHPGCNEILRRHCMDKHVQRMHEDRTESDDRPPCPQCGKRFTNKYILQDHIDGVHMGKREYVCDWPGCGKKFARPWNLTVHRRIHTDEKPLQCELCGFRGRQKNSMNHHYKTHHKDYVPKST